MIGNYGGHSRILIGVDSNGHVGEGRCADNDGHIGTGGGEKHNWNGKRMVKFLNNTDMTAINTHHAETCGKTYYTRREGSKLSTRVYKIRMARNATTMVKGIQT